MFAKFRGKHLCQSLFLNKVAGLRPATVLRRLLHRCFPVNFCKIFKNIYLYRKSLMAVSVDTCITLRYDHMIDYHTIKTRSERSSNLDFIK